MENTNRKLKSGDVVRLKSGGPLMTVDSYVPRYVIDNSVRTQGPVYACESSAMRQDGENVRLFWFPESGPTPIFHMSQAEVHEDALQVFDAGVQS